MTMIKLIYRDKINYLFLRSDRNKIKNLEDMFILIIMIIIQKEYVLSD